jgi:hypothetical protein
MLFEAAPLSIRVAVLLWTSLLLPGCQVLVLVVKMQEFVGSM